jgi:hypothetical protein
MSTEPVERFKPTSGAVTGYAGLLLVATAIGYVAVAMHTVTGLRVALGALLLGVLIWVTQLRPRATAYPDSLLLRNSLTDTSVPLVLIDDVSVRQTLNVWAGGRRYICIGIGRSARHALRGSRRPATSMLGMGKLNDLAQQADRRHPEQSQMSYETFVVTRIDDLVTQAKSTRSNTAESARVTHTVAWPETIVLALAGLGFATSLLL